MSRIKTTILLVITFFSFAAQAIDTPQQHQTKKVISLSWSATEALLALGVTPVGVADPNGYSEWVNSPPLPNDVRNIGTRAEPNLAVIYSLKPDLIIGGPSHNSEQLGKIGTPVLILDTFRADHDNGKSIDQDFLKIATAIGKTTEAEKYLQQRDKNIQQWKQKLEAHFSGNIPKVSLTHFLNTSTAILYGGNSSVEYALSKLGIKPAIKTESTAWGQNSVSLQQLTEIGDNILIYIRPFAEEKKLLASPLWKNMPFVKQNHFLTIEPCWTFGSGPSIERIAQVTTEALLTLQP